MSDPRLAHSLQANTSALAYARTGPRTPSGLAAIATLEAERARLVDQALATRDAVALSKVPVAELNRLTADERGHQDLGATAALAAIRRLRR